MTGYTIGEIPLILKRHPRARSLKLRFDAQKGAALLTLPPGVAERKALQFAEKHHDWIKEQFDISPNAVRLTPGAVIPLRGEELQITHRPQSTPLIHQENNKLIIGGPESGFETRLQNWLRKQARHDILHGVDALAPLLGQKPHHVTIRDTKSRWGSCSSRKTLSFSWRLIMASPKILTYVVAHEMAHLVEMNHSPAFWVIVAKLDPNWKTSRRWLKSEGNRLMMIG